MTRKPVPPPTSTRQGHDGLFRTAALLPHPDPERGQTWQTVGVGRTREEAREAYLSTHARQEQTSKRS